MTSNLKRLAAMAVVGAVCILTPVASASAAVTSTDAPAALWLPSAGLDPGALSFVGPSVAPGGFGVIGPTVYTVGSANVFVGTTITTTAGGAAVTTGTG